MKTVAIVGAGMAGLSCAATLKAAGASVTLFDKSRGPGGRMSTRRSGHRRYDHGAQYFTARDPEFQAQVAQWVADGLVAPWDGRLATLRHGLQTPHHAEHPRYVGVPRMSALTRNIAAPLGTLHTSVRVTSIAADGRIQDADGNDLGTFDVAVVATPAAQAVPLLAAAPALAEAAEAAVMAPCLAAMVTVEPAIPLPIDGAWVQDSPLAWIARNASKPGRPDGDSWVLHATHAWSVANMERSKEDVAAMLWEALGAALGGRTGTPVELVGHRWRYAFPEGPYPTEPLFEAKTGIGACGDWCVGPRVEAAWLSGRRLARAIIAGT